MVRTGAYFGSRMGRLNRPINDFQGTFMKPRAFRVSLHTFAFAALLLILGGFLLGAGWWLHPIGDAEQAVREGRLQPALESYGVAEKRFAAFPVSKRLLPELYDLVIKNELSVMYALSQYDAVIDKAGATGTPGGKFWAGCALFVKADVEWMKPETRMSWLAQAQEEFRRAVEASSADFDAKFNYELTGKLIAGLRKDPNAERPKEMNLLKPSNAQSPKKVG